MKYFESYELRVCVLDVGEGWRRTGGRRWFESTQGRDSLEGLRGLLAMLSPHLRLMIKNL